MPAGVVIEGAVWLAVLVAMIVLFTVVARRLRVLTARTRGLERVQQQAEALERRFSATVNPLVARLDDLRRHAAEIVSVEQEVSAAQVVLEALAAEARAMRVPGAASAIAASLSHETERSVRAAALVAHGLRAIGMDHGTGEREGETSLKRGTLGLRHAHEALVRSVAELAAIRPGDLATHAERQPVEPGRHAGEGFADDAF